MKLCAAVSFDVYRLVDIEHPLTQKLRYLDKLVDEPLKGWASERILPK